MHSSFVLPIVLAALPILACGAVPDGPDRDAGPARATDGASPDGDNEKDARSIRTAEDAGEHDADAGTLVLEAYGGAPGDVAADAYSIDPGVVAQMETCSDPVVSGACRLTYCKLGGVDSPGPITSNFGTISVSAGAKTQSMTYNGTGYPAVDFGSTVTLGEGDTMRFRGGNVENVPAFDVSATIPGLAVITSPSPVADGGATIIDTSQDLSVTWMPISIGRMNFELEAYEAFAFEALVACAFEGTSGSGVVSRGLLSSMKNMSGTTPTYASLYSELDVTTVVDNLTIVTHSVQSTPTAGANFGVTFE
jgi:hypothetical protein